MFSHTQYITLYKLKEAYGFMEHLNESTRNFWVCPGWSYDFSIHGWLYWRSSMFFSRCPESHCVQPNILHQTRCGQRRPEAAEATRIPALTCQKTRDKKKASCWIMDFQEFKDFLWAEYRQGYDGLPPELPQSRKSPAVNDPSERTWQSVDPVSGLSFLLCHRSGVCLPPVTSHPRRDLEVCSGITQELVTSPELL